MGGLRVGTLPVGVRGFAAALTSFVGRADEVGKVAGLLEEYRLVTVTGPGGVGKTRLAGAVARQVVGRFADGVQLVELAAVADPAFVITTVAAAVGAQLETGTSALDSLVAALARQQVLLVLDNCEHVLGAVTELCHALLGAADDMRILATSRAPVGVTGETRFRLRPLAVPDPATGGSAAASAAVVLFTERARQADPEFALTSETGPVVARLVTRLDGMPLAIELAAARVEALGVDQLLGRLETSFGLLTSSDLAATARQRSLAATVTWSYQLLASGTQEVFRELALLPGPFTLEAAENVAGPGAELAVLDLVSCSLLTPPQTGTDGRSRYLMLDTLRAFGTERLAEAGELPQAAAALARYVLQVAELAAAGMRISSGEMAAARWLDAETAAVDQSLAWAQRQDLALALRLAVALAPWWLLRGRSGDAFRFLSAAIGTAVPGSDIWCAAQLLLAEAASNIHGVHDALGYFTAARDSVADRGASPVLADALAGQADCLSNLGQFPEGRREAHRALEMSRELGYLTGETNALIELAAASFYENEIEVAVDWARQACRIDPAQLPGKVARECSVLLAIILRATDDVAGAERSCAEGLAQTVEAGDRQNQAIYLVLLTDLDIRARRISEAAAHLREAAGLAMQTSDRARLIACLDLGGHLCAAAGQWADALTLWAAYIAGRLRDGSLDLPRDRDLRQVPMTKASQALGATRTREAQERGTAMTLETAVEFVSMLASTGLAGPPAEPATELTQLSAREQELVTLVAQGDTDAQIAGHLFISVSTVRSHLDRIRDKTGCRRRADLTRLALRAGLA
jgi:predicted ATPase/DNA-binding CsgD family transcriptional regulator